MGADGRSARILATARETAEKGDKAGWRIPLKRNLRTGGSSSLWRPLRVSTFRNLLLADVVSDIGTFMQNVGAAWLMVSLGAGPIYVALTQTAASLPYFLLALPARQPGISLTAANWSWPPSCGWWA